MKKLHKYSKHSLDVSGFTIVELMIATAVFSVVLIIIVFGIISITKTYTKGITVTNTQNIARNIVNDVSQSIQFDGCGSSGSCLTPTGGIGAGVAETLCIGAKEYIYQVGYEVEPPPVSHYQSDQSLNGLVVIDGVSCPLAPSSFRTASVANSIEFLNPNMRLSYFNVSKVSGSTSLYNVDVEITYGNDDVLTSPVDATDGTTACLGTAAQQDFCATAKLDTVVQARVD